MNLTSISEISTMSSSPVQSILGLSLTTFLILVLVVTIIKGLALWRAVERKQKVWFWVLVFVNTFGILDLLYLLIFSKRRR